MFSEGLEGDVEVLGHTADGFPLLGNNLHGQEETVLVLLGLFLLLIVTNHI